MSAKHPCQEPAGQPAGQGGARRPVVVRRVDEMTTTGDLLTHCLPAFGGAFLRRIYSILDEAIGSGCPLTVAVSGPVTVSGQHQVWLNPLIETGWVAYLSMTDAICYHDGHRSLDAYKASFAKKGDVLVVDPASSEFFRAFRNSGSGTVAPTPAAPR